jgi:uncharacterized protein YjgD (DUF1641 family)
MAGEPTPKTSPLTVLKRALVDKEHTIADLEEKLAAADRDGSLFDLKRDTAEDIGTAIANSISETKARNIIKSITEAIAAKRRQQSPAG